ncbi:MAG: aspartate carbamoyltransferase catalytic subunit [Pseudomonadota bacterium]
MNPPVSFPDRPYTSGWDPYLDPGEKVLWEGAPEPGLRFKLSDIPLSLFGCLFGGFAIFWIAMATSMSGGITRGPGAIITTGFPLFGLPFLAVGAYFAFGRFFWAAYVRGKTRYALTNKRGIIASSAISRKLTSYPIDADTAIEFQPGAAATLYFAAEEKRGNKGRRYTVKHGFEYIRGGDEVYRLMRQVQQQRIRQDQDA